MKSPKCEFITRELIDGVCREARLSARLRKNYNLHRDEAEPVNRLLNAMHRGSYIPVHRHLNPALCESGVVIRGRVGVVVYDDEGVVTHSQQVGEGCDACGFDIEAGLWHGLVGILMRYVIKLSQGKGNFSSLWKTRVFLGKALLPRGIPLRAEMVFISLEISCHIPQGTEILVQKFLD